MKMLQKIFLVATVALFSLGFVNQAQAYYDRYPDGYWDNHGHYQHYEIYHHHRGYWDQRNGARIFIQIG